MQAISCLWNHDGSILAVCGMKNPPPGVTEPKESNQVMFYDPKGMHLRSLKVPGREITSLSWEGKGLRIALAVDSFIYFANIRPDYMWCYFAKTVAFLQTYNAKFGTVINFWDTNSNQCFHKQVENPMAMAASTDHCIIAVESMNVDPKDANILVESSFKDRLLYQLLICNSMGTTVDAKYTDLKPQFLAMNATHVVIASRDQFLLWQYHTPKGSSHLHHHNLHGGKGRRDKRYHIDDTPSGVAEVLNDLDKGGYEPPTSQGPTNDPICCVAISTKCLLIGRESGKIQEYTIPHVAICNRYSLPNSAYMIAINCNSSRAAVIDSAGTLTTIDLTTNNATIGGNDSVTGRVERKDVWAVCWARDNPQLLAIMEKTRMYVFRGGDPEEPISCSGYICNFEDLEITAVLLDDIVNGASLPNATEHLLQLRVKSLRDTEELLTHVGIPEAKQFIEDNPHPRLFRLLAEASLKTLDFETAESSFVRCTNYPGLQLIKRLRTVQNESLQRAEVSAFFGDFDTAEKLYIDADRRDLAIDLRQTLCDWFRTVQLYRMGPGISDQQMEQAWREIGNHFANLRSWESAREYYEKAHYIEGLMEALYHLEQYDDLESCVHKLPEKNGLLAKLGQMFASVGMCDQAVTAYLKLGDVKSAVNVCVSLRQWGQAVELAQKFKMPQISVLLEKHATQLLQEGRLPEAIELQRKAGRFLDSARLLMKLAEGEAKRYGEYLRVKKIYVLAGLMAEDYLRLQTTLLGTNRSSMLSQLSPEDAALVEQIWHHAEAYHFMLLAQRQLRSGLMHSAVLTALRLREYDDVLCVEDIYTLLALASCADRSFGTCSKAFIKLESLDGISEAKRVDYEELAVNIFSKHDPNDNRSDRVECFTCEALVSDWCTSCPNCGTHFPPCISSGKPLVNAPEAWLCNICHHCSYPTEITERITCPLCHAKIEGGKY